MSLPMPHIVRNICALALLGMTVSGCIPAKKFAIEGDFPTPVMPKTSIRLGIHLDDELLSFVHKETIEKKGSWEVTIGSAQEALFSNLAEGLFEGYAMVDSLVLDETVTPGLDGVLKPSIAEAQFSMPVQTRSNYYEVWIRYNFQLYDRQGNLVGEWKLPAYGKASKRNYGSSSSGLRAAAMAACRDAMAFFSINFNREPVVAKWLGAGMPIVPAQVSPSQANTAQTTAATAASATPAVNTITPNTSAPIPVPQTVPSKEDQAKPLRSSLTGRLQTSRS